MRMYKTPFKNGWIMIIHMIFPFTLSYPNPIYSIALEWAMLIVLWKIDADDYFILYYFVP
jgi:hypothetical protein